MPQKYRFINEIGNLCKKLGIDTYEVATGMGLDKRIGRPFLDSGIGWGGSCFPKDVDALIAWAKEIKEPTRIIESTKEVNADQPLRLVKILQKHIPKLKGKTIGILGLAFKPNTDDIRDSRAIPIIKELLRNGAQIKAYDPQAMDNFKTLYPNNRILLISLRSPFLRCDPHHHQMERIHHLRLPGKNRHRWTKT